MTKWKRLLALVLALVMTLSLASMPTFADGGDGVKKTYNIVINYVFENNENVSVPYTANLAEGTSFNTTVTFPTVQGYLPYVGEEQKNSIELNYPSVSKDVTINVVYKPTNVNYTVIYYQQNVDNDLYTEVTRVTKQGLTGTPVADVTEEYEGFYQLLYEQPAIAADGSTVIEVYYDRSYYLINFDLGGGYGTDPIFARYDTNIGEVPEPTKAGYKFEGWAVAENGTTAVTLPTKMPAENQTYYAIWKPADTAKVTLVFWGENANDEQYSYLSTYTQELQLKPGSEVTFGESGYLTCGQEEHTHNDDCYELTCTTEVHEHNGDCYTCGNAEHKHTVGCYEGAGSSASPLNPPDNPKNGQVYSGSFLFGSYSYIYINGSWYNYSGSVANGGIVSPNCSMTEHTHTDACIGCGKTGHTHTRANCYKLLCTKTEHTHTSACYEQGAGLDSTLWKFVKSDTVTVAADGSTVVNVYYDRVEFTITFKDGNTTVKTLTEKWGADISEHWPVVGTNGTTYNSGERWKPSGSSTYKEVLVYLSIMPAESFTLTVDRANYDTYYMHYMVEALPGASDTTTYNGTSYVERFSVTANYNYVTKAEDFFDLNGFTQKESNPKFDSDGIIDINNGGDVYFYYTRNSYKLTFNDQYNDVKDETVKFEAPLSTYKDYVPEVPSAYEKGSVVFGGWYQNPQCTGEEYKLDEHTMPYHDVILYAKWVPVEHTVKFYLTEQSTDIYKPATAAAAASFEVPHADNIAEEYVKNHLTREAMNGAKPNGDYTFVMWYYYENGVKTPFDPTMQIRKDLTLYGEWSSNVLKQYTVQFVLKDDHSVKVADDLTGSGLAGTTKTFDVKGGTELYAAYREGYFPTVQSQSLLLDIESDSLVVTFEYVPAEAVPYTVKYVDKDTGASLADDKVVSDNRKAVVTETFEPISGYMPDAYQKRLVVTADGENILYFYYTKDDVHALYQITHLTQNTDGVSWTEYASSTAQGDIGTRYTASAMTIPGFTYDHIEYVVNGNVVTDVTAEGAKLTANGLEIKLYYVRNAYPFEVQHLDMAGNQLVAPNTGSAKYGEVISYADYVKTDIPSAEYHHANPETITIQIENAPARNIIRIYYQTYCYVNHMWFGDDGAVTDVATEEKLPIGTGLSLNFTQRITAGSLYGGTFTENTCTTPIDDPWNTTATRDTHYYIWEVPNDYLRPFTMGCWEKDAELLYYVMGIYMTSGIDRANYAEVGFNLNGVDVPATQQTLTYTDEEQNEVTQVVDSITNQTYAFGQIRQLTKNGTHDATIDVSKAVPGYTHGYLLCYGLSDEEYKWSELDKDGAYPTFQYAPYWVTLDGVRVESGMNRTIQYLGHGATSEYTNFKVTLKSGTAETPSYSPVTPAEDASVMTLELYTADGTAIPAASAPVEDDDVTVTVTVVDGENSYAVEPTDGVVSLTPAGMEGKLFAGWYRDGVASDLTGLTEDCTLTARYVSDDYLGLKYNRSGLLRINGVTLVSAIDSNSYAETGFLVNGEKIVVDSYATRYRLIYNAGSLFGGDVERKAPMMVYTYDLSGSGSLTVAPYWVTADGTTVTGPERSLSYTNWTIRG